MKPAGLTYSPPTARPARRPARCRFTLLELLVATAIVLIIALLSFQFFSNLQNVWQHMVGRTNTHEDARLALGILTRDLQAALACTDDRPGFDIRFHQPSPTAVWFVCDSSADSTVPCSLIEVGYRFQAGRLERAFVDQSNAAWNIYGDRDDAHDQGDYQVIVDAVTSLQFSCFDDAHDPFVPSQFSRLPAFVCVTLSVMDARDHQRWLALPAGERPTFEKKVARTFWRTVRPR